MIEAAWQLLQELAEYIKANFDPVWGTLDILIITFGLYWLLLLIRGTRSVQILVGLIVLLAASLASEIFDLSTLGMILDKFLGSAVLIIIVLFQHEIRRALARVGRGFFPTVTPHEESQMVEEVVRAGQTLSQRRVGALIVLEREMILDDQIEAGTPVDAAVSKELLTSIFLPYSPLHDGAVVIQRGRVAYAGCILPLTLRDDLPDGLGTRHRAAVGITEETDAVVVVVSEETATISVVMGSELLQDLDAPRLRVVLRDIMSGKRRDLSTRVDVSREVELRSARDARDEPSKVTETRPAQAGKR